jgi:holo-[acyl-carrier protein] synthase
VQHVEMKMWSRAQDLIAHASVTDETDYAASFCVVEQSTTP